MLPACQNPFAECKDNLAGYGIKTVSMLQRFKKSNRILIYPFGYPFAKAFSALLIANFSLNLA
jgi:hypothetical protein